MPFTVQPSDQVVIDMTAIGPDDFLRLTLEDSSRLYVRLSPGDEYRAPHLTFDQSMLPADFEEFCRQQVVVALGPTWGVDYDQLKRWYEQRPDKQRDMALLDYIALKLRQDASIAAGFEEEVNVGTRPTVWLSGEGLWSDACHILARWAFPAPITHIEPVSRIEALVEYALASVAPPQSVTAQVDGDGIED